MCALPLYVGKMLRLSALNAVKDAPTAAMWTYDPEVAGRFRDGPANPMNVHEVQKIFEVWVKEAEESRRDFIFAIRPRVDDRLVGFIRMAQVQWVHGAGLIGLVIGATEDRDAYMHEALEMGLNYAFDELNLFRVTMRTSADDHAARELFEAANFTLEVCQRQADYRDGKYIDRLSYGLLRTEWLALRSVEVS